MNHQVCEFETLDSPQIAEQASPITK